MLERTVVVTNPAGLHARPAAQFVRAAAQFASAIRVGHGAKEADAKSILAVLALGVHQGARITLRIEGPDEGPAMEHLVSLLASGPGEP